MRLLTIALLFVASVSHANESANSANSMSADEVASANPGTSPYANLAYKCGVEMQKQCHPDNMGGKSMCGRAVGLMVKCLSPQIGSAEKCQKLNGCGNGKDYINCTNGFMKECGYKKVEPADSAICAKAGAVISYSKTPTEAGQKYGHVEFLCGDGKFCSIYSQVNYEHWPSGRKPEACWFPMDKNGNVPFIPGVAPQFQNDYVPSSPTQDPPSYLYQDEYESPRDMVEDRKSDSGAAAGGGAGAGIGALIPAIGNMIKQDGKSGTKQPTQTLTNANSPVPGWMTPVMNGQAGQVPAPGAAPAPVPAPGPGATPGAENANSRTADPTLNRNRVPDIKSQTIKTKSKTPANKTGK